MNNPVKVGSDNKIDIDQESLKNEKMAALWLSYGLQRVRWSDGLFTKEFPKETQYRHSLAEECDAIRTMIKVGNELIANGSLKLADVDSSIRLLMDLDTDGLLESFVLLATADEGISRDYAAYRALHRDMIETYLAGWVIHDK